MYVGDLSDFFYKPKSWIFQQPKFNQKIDNSYINHNGKIFKINELTGEIKKQISFPKIKKKSKIKPKSNIIKKNIYKNSSNNNNYRTISVRNPKFKDFYKQSPDNIIIKKPGINNTVNLQKNNSIQIKKINKNDYLNINITPTDNNAKYSSKNKTLEPIFSKTDHLSENQKSNHTINILQNQRIFIPFFNKTHKKYFKPPIAFGKKITKKFSLGDKIKNKISNKPTEKRNLLYLLHKQHNNNLFNEGKIDEKIYERDKDDNVIFKTYRDQIFKEKIVHGLKKKYKFYEDNDKELKTPLIHYYNYNFYRGYSFSDKNRIPIHHKLFFKYINIDKLKQKEEKKNEKNYN